MKNIDLSDSNTRYILGIFASAIVIVILFIILQVIQSGRSPVIVEPDNNNQLDVSRQSEDGQIIMFEQDGRTVVEVSDYRITEQEARDELGIPDSQEIDFSVPAVAGPRPVVTEAPEPIDYDRWGLVEDYAE